MDTVCRAVKPAVEGENSVARCMNILVLRDCKITKILSLAEVTLG